MISVYLDTCAIQRPLDDQGQLRIRLEAEAVLGVLSACAAGAAHLLASDMHAVETARNPHPTKRDFAEDVLALVGEMAPLTEGVQRRAESYVAEGLRAPDALHLASAVEQSADYFCTTDDKLVRVAERLDTKGVRVVSPLLLVSDLDLR